VKGTLEVKEGQGKYWLGWVGKDRLGWVGKDRLG
jgi:hypothetical protein